MKSRFEYFTVAELRTAYPDALEDVEDSAALMSLDFLTESLEELLGHAFGRGVYLYSDDDETVTVGASSLVIGDDEYKFVDYPTLGDLEGTLASHASRSFRRLPVVVPSQPSASLCALSATTIGPGYESRVVLGLSDMFVKMTGSGKSHIFLPLEILSMVSVVEDLVTLVRNGDYYDQKSWLIKAPVPTTANVHNWWATTAPDNIQVRFKPSLWGSIPGPVRAFISTAYGDSSGGLPYESETFMEYSYRRGSQMNTSWRDNLISIPLRKYARKVVI